MRHIVPRLVMLLILFAAGAGSLTHAAPHSAPIISADRSPRLPAARAKLGSALAALLDEYQTYQQHNAGITQPVPFTPSNPFLRIADARVNIDAVAAGDPQALKRDLEALGLEQAAVFGRDVGGRLPIAALEPLATLDSLAFARPAYARTSTGAVTSQGDTAMGSDVARSNTGVSGSGVLVGVISDSYNCLGGAPGNVASNDLPPNIQVLAELSDCGNGTDEGRAMMQIIHDVAPGAPQAFHTGFESEADFAQGILDLANAGASVIVDDVGYFFTPMFQDGALAQAVAQVKQRGVAYFSAAGNSGRASYESPFRPGSSFTLGNAHYVGHDFNPGSGEDLLQSLTVPAFGAMAMALQWDQPFFSVSGPPGASTDLDIFFTNSAGILFGPAFAIPGVDANIGGDPAEVAVFQNPTFTPLEVNVVIGKAGNGPNPGLLKYIVFYSGGAVSINEFATNSSTSYGQPNAAEAAGVGAAFFGDTPAFGTNPPVAEPFSSAGGTPILFDTSGRRLNSPVVRQKPDIVAPDGVNTTFFGQDTPRDGDPLPNFFGTSAAAPHAAGAAALLREANPALAPDDMYAVLRQTANNMAAPGFDFDTGYGLVRADSAVQQAIPELALTSASAGQVPFGSTADYRFVVTNTSSSAYGTAAGVVLTSQIPAGMQFVSAVTSSGAPCAVANSVVTCTLGALPGGAQLLVTITVRPTAPGSYTAQASVATSSLDANSANNNATATITVPAGKADEANLNLFASGSPNPVAAGDEVLYTLQLANAGQLTAQAISLTVALPAGATLRAIDGAGWSCPQIDAITRCTLPSLGVALAPDLFFLLQAPQDANSMTLTVTVTSATRDGDATYNSASVTTAVLQRQQVLPLIVR